MKNPYPGITQNPEELDELSEIIRGLCPRVVLEIGMDTGGSLRHWAKLATEDAFLIGVDNDFHRVSFQPAYPEQQAALLLADSTRNSTLTAVKQLLNGGQIDFLFIDGDHRMPAMTSDYRFYAPLVRPGGLIAFHDVCSHTDGPQFWEWLKPQVPNPQTIFNPEQQPPCGVGWYFQE